GAPRASLADDVGQARDRPAELRDLQTRAGEQEGVTAVSPALSLRDAFAPKQSSLSPRMDSGWLRGACHRAALCAGPLARDDGICLPPEPLRRALFGERLRSLDIILRRGHRLHG